LGVEEGASCESEASRTCPEEGRCQEVGVEENGGVVMKAKKALKRLAKIEALMSDVTERYSASAPHIREVLQDAKAAVNRAKEAVSLQASSGTAKNPPVEHSKPKSKPTPEPEKPKRKLSAAGRKAIIAATKARWARVRAESTGATKTTQPAAAKKATPKKVARKKIAVKKMAAKAPTAKAKKTVRKAPTKGAVKKAAPKKSAPATTAQAPAKMAALVTAEPTGAAESAPTPEAAAQ
jgi:hypothetical protein